MNSPNTCFLESHPGPKRLESHPGPKKLSVSLLMEVQINIEMYFSRSPPQAPIFFWMGAGGVFFPRILQPVPLLHLLYSVFGVKHRRKLSFFVKNVEVEGGGLLSPNLKSENPFLKRGFFIKGGLLSNIRYEIAKTLTVLY